MTLAWFGVLQNGNLERALVFGGGTVLILLLLFGLWLLIEWLLDLRG